MGELMPRAVTDLTPSRWTEAMRVASSLLARAGWELKCADVSLVHGTARVEVASGSRYVTLDVRGGRSSVTRETLERVTVTVGRRGDRCRVERIRPRLLGRAKFAVGGVRSAMRYFAEYLDANGTGLLVGRSALGLLLDAATRESDAHAALPEAPRG